MKYLFSLITAFLSFVSIAQIPNWVETSCNGTEYSIHTELQNGNAVILDFGSMWCAPCLASAPELETVWQNYGQGSGEVKVFDFLVEDQNYNIADCTDLSNWESNLSLSYPGFANANVSSIFTQYNALYGNSGIPLILMFLPSTNDPSTSSLVYNSTTGLGVQTADLSNDLQTILSDNGFLEVGINEIDEVEKILIKIVDFMGRETDLKPNTPLIFIYSDGTSEIKIED